MAKLDIQKMANEAANEIMNQVRSDTGMTLKECWEKQIPMKVDVYGHNNAINTDIGTCPKCNGKPLRACDFNYCPNCGQRLDWGD